MVPSKDYSHGGGLPVPLFSEGRQTEDAQAEQKKKDYENYITKKELRAREQIRTIEQSDTSTGSAERSCAEARHAFAD